MSFTDVKIKIPDRKYDQGDVNDVMHRKRARRILGDLKKLVELSSASGEDGWLSLARHGLVSDEHVVWGRWKSQVYLTPYVEKPFNSKVIKSFVPELRSRKCFSCFGIPMFYVYMLSYLLTPPLGQDMTQGQFLSGV